MPMTLAELRTDRHKHLRFQDQVYEYAGISKTSRVELTHPVIGHVYADPEDVDPATEEEVKSVDWGVFQKQEQGLAVGAKAALLPTGGSLLSGDEMRARVRQLPSEHRGWAGDLVEWFITSTVGRGRGKGSRNVF